MSKEKRRVPKLRFPGFTEDWEQRKLESLFTKYEDKVNTPSSGYWRLGLRSHCKGTFHTYIDAGNELEIAEMNRVKSGNFILNITFAWERALAVTNDEDQDKLVSHRFPQFKPNNDLVIDFFKHTLTDKRFKHHLELSSPGGAGRNKVLKVADMLKYELLVPSIKEQNEISSFLNHVDYIITLHQRKLDNLKLKKKALLQKLFPKNGERYPELRFPGFTDAWEQRKLNDLVTIRRGLTYKPSDIAENGIRVLRSSNIDEDQFITSNDDVFVNIEAVNIPFAKNGDILITSANGSNRLVGKHTIIRDIADNSAVHGGFMLLAESNNPLFTDALLSSNWYKRFINTYVAGGNGAIGNLSKSDLESQIVMVPSEHEQAKIGQWYDNINQLITLHQRKLDHLQLQKKALLQQMFV